MPEPVLILTAMGIAIAAASLTFVICGWRWAARLGLPGLTQVGFWAWASGSFSAAGCLGIRPHWPPREDHRSSAGSGASGRRFGRSCWRLLPRYHVGWSGRCDWPSWRAVLGFCCTGPATSPTSAGPGTSEWSPPLAWFDFWRLGRARGGGLGSAWLCWFAGRRTVAATEPGGYSAAAAVTVMLSGYATRRTDRAATRGGHRGCHGCHARLTRIVAGTGPLGVPIIGLFSLLVIGRFFGELSFGSRGASLLRSVAGLAPRAALCAPAAVMGPRTGPRDPCRAPRLGYPRSVPREVRSRFSIPIRGRRRRAFRSGLSELREVEHARSCLVCLRKNDNPLDGIQGHFYNCPMSDNCQRSDRCRFDLFVASFL